MENVAKYLKAPLCPQIMCSKDAVLKDVPLVNERFSSRNFQEKSMIKMQLSAMHLYPLALDVNPWVAVHFKAGEANSSFF